MKYPATPRTSKTRMILPPPERSGGGLRRGGDAVVSSVRPTDLSRTNSPRSFIGIARSCNSPFSAATPHGIRVNVFEASHGLSFHDETAPRDHLTAVKEIDSVRTGCKGMAIIAAPT